MCLCEACPASQFHSPLPHSGRFTQSIKKQNGQITPKHLLFLQRLYIHKLFKRIKANILMQNVDQSLRTSVVMPTYNEAKNITPLIERTIKSLQGTLFEIIVVDDDSPDKTWEIAQNLNQAEVRVIRRVTERGLVSAIQTGINEARGDFVVWLDADLSMPPEFIPYLVDQLETNDISLGSRYVEGGRDLRPVLRLVTSRMMNLAANLVLNFKVLDYTSGFVAARKDVLKQLPLAKSSYGEYCIEFLYHAGKKGYKIKEVPYDFVDRVEGTSKTADSISSLLRFGFIYGKRILRLRFFK
jgi:dolichol-phosphate mannosyltransferase